MGESDMSVQVLKHNEVALVQVPASWTIRDIRLEQSRVHRWTLKNEIPAKVIIVGGGEESNGFSTIQELSDANNADREPAIAG